MSGGTISEQMERLFALNLESPDAQSFPQTRRAPDPLERIPTLDPSRFEPATPMLAERFSTYGHWDNATPGHTWLSITEMEKANRDGAL